MQAFVCHHFIDVRLRRLFSASRNARGIAGTVLLGIATVGLAVIVAVGCVGEARANGSVIDLSDRGSVSKIRLTLDKSKTVQLDRDVTEALVANPAIADVVPLTVQSLYLVGKKIGLTRLTLLGADKRLIGIVEIEVTFDIEALRRELNSNVPSGDFKIRTANGRLILSGTVGDAVALSRATEITEQFAPGQFLNMMAVRAPQQVLLEVRFVEANRSAGRDLGLSWDVASNRFRGLSGAGVVPGDPILTGAASAASLLSGNAAFGTFLTRILAGGVQADILIQALEKRGLARRLAEPNLVTLSGDTANFLAGGEFPFPVDAGDRRTTVEFKKFGVGLAFTPTVLSRGQINLKIEPEVSDLDYSNSFTTDSGVNVPGLVVRRASTTVELRDGQSFAIAGLLQTRHSKNVDQLPWLGTVPVLGMLFKSSSYAKSESDLVIIVTPHLVKPASPDQHLMTPLDQKLSSNDRDFFVRSHLEVDAKKPTLQGHIIDVDGGWAPQTYKDGGPNDSYK